MNAAVAVGVVWVMVTAVMTGSMTTWPQALSVLTGVLALTLSPIQHSVLQDIYRFRLDADLEAVAIPQSQGLSILPTVVVTAVLSFIAASATGTAAAAAATTTTTAAAAAAVGWTAKTKGIASAGNAITKIAGVCLALSPSLVRQMMLSVGRREMSDMTRRVGDVEMDSRDVINMEWTRREEDESGVVDDTTTTKALSTKRRKGYGLRTSFPTLVVTTTARTRRTLLQGKTLVSRGVAARVVV